MKNKLFIVLGIFMVIIGLVGLFGIYRNQDKQTVGQTKFYYPDGSTVATSGKMTITSSTRIIATSTTFRTAAQICNTDSVPVYLSFRNDKIPASGTFDYHLAAGACFEITANNGLYQGAVRASSTDQTSDLTVNEFQI